MPGGQVREPGCNPFWIWIQHQHRAQEGLVSLFWALTSCPKRPFWKLPCWEVWPVGPLLVTYTQAPEQGLRHLEDRSSKCCSH